MPEGQGSEKRAGFNLGPGLAANARSGSGRERGRDHKQGAFGREDGDIRRSDGRFAFGGAPNAGLIADGSRRDLLGNTLVLVGTGKPAEAPIADLPTLLGEAKLAMALVDSVPAGQYGKEALTSLGLWDQVESHVAQADNVRAALMLVATGEAPLGIVYGSDAVAEPGVGVVATFPKYSHKPITYPAAVTSNADTPQAAAFLDSLSQEPAKAVFEAQGFTVRP